MSMLELISIDPIATQRAARAVINAVSLPGRIVVLETPTAASALRAFAPLGAHVHIAPGAARGGFRLPQGLMQTPLPEASFVLALGDELAALLAKAQRGTLLHPEDAALVFVQVEALSAASLPGGLKLEVVGPGAPQGRAFHVRGLSSSAVVSRAEANSEFPMGIDLILVGQDGAAVGLPRSVRLNILEA